MPTRPKLGLPRREFINGQVHYGAPFKRTGILCQGRPGEEKIGGRWAPFRPRQLQVRRPVTCARCIEIAQWVWSHRIEKPGRP